MKIVLDVKKKENVVEHGCKGWTNTNIFKNKLVALGRE